jgi:hypothetical protein
MAGKRANNGVAKLKGPHHDMSYGLNSTLIQVGIAPFSIDRVVEDCVLLVTVSEHVSMFLKHFHGWQIQYTY